MRACKALPAAKVWTCTTESHVLSFSRVVKLSLPLATDVTARESHPHLWQTSHLDSDPIITIHQRARRELGSTLRAISREAAHLSVPNQRAKVGWTALCFPYDLCWQIFVLPGVTIIQAKTAI